MQYFAPRACLTLGLGCNLSNFSSTNEILDGAKIGLAVSPNPASDEVRFKTYTGYLFRQNNAQGRVCHPKIDVQLI
jgi:hypothetical protein